MRHHLLKRQAVEHILILICGTLAAVALFILMGLTIVDVVGRKWFQNSLPGALEMTEILMALVIFASLPLVSWNDQHVVFSAFDSLLPLAVRRWQARIVHIINTGSFLTLSWLFIEHTIRFSDFGQVTAQLRIPMAPVAALMAVLLLVAALIHLLLALFWYEEEPSLAAQATDP